MSLNRFPFTSLLVPHSHCITLHEKANIIKRNDGNEHMQSRARISVDGVVQGVGYRYAVRSIARSHNLVGSIRNMEDGTVEIVCEGERDQIESFVSEIKNVKEPVRVDKVDVKFEEPRKEFRTFRIIAGDLTDEVVEGFSTGSAYFNIMLAKQDQMLVKQDQMLVKQDHTIGEIRLLREEMRTFLDERFRRLEKEIDAIKAKLGMT
ncbi:MAG: acylphosphatase [Nitrososphaerales archaeon]